MAGRGYSGANAVAFLNVDYEYAGHHYDEPFGPNGAFNVLKMNLEMVKDLDQYRYNYAKIGAEAVEYARSFLTANGNVDTGNLLDSIRSDPNGNTITLSAPARDERGHPYGGHIEYGFTDLKGRPHGPWPFLRPAMRIAIADSRGEFQEAMIDIMRYGLNSSYLRGGSRVELGRSGNRASSLKSYRARSTIVEKSRGVRPYIERSTNEKKWDAHIYAKNYNGFNSWSTRNDYTVSSYDSNTEHKWRAGEL